MKQWHIGSLQRDAFVASHLLPIGKVPLDEARFEGEHLRRWVAMPREAA